MGGVGGAGGTAPKGCRGCGAGTWVGAHSGMEVLGWGRCHGRVGGPAFGEVPGGGLCIHSKRNVTGGWGGWLVGVSVGLVGRDSRERAGEHWVCHMLPE